MVILSLLLLIGFLTVSLVSFYVSRSSLRSQITYQTLPLTSDNIYSEIQRDLLQPILISSLMAHNTFLIDWIINGENNIEEIARYLKVIKTRYHTYSSFLISEKTKNYYYSKGILKVVQEDEPRDTWYYRVRKMTDNYEINVDPDLANNDSMTIFINHRVFDDNNHYIGATGVGLTTSAVKNLIESYQDKYNSNIYFTDTDGDIVIYNSMFPELNGNIRLFDGLTEHVADILGKDFSSLQYTKDEETIHLIARYIPELNWYLIVEKTETEAIQNIRQTLIVNLFLCLIISIVVIFLTWITVNAYQKTNTRQKEEIIKQKQDLLEKNQSLEEAILKVKKLSGLLPICASCKNIRDDKGYWQQIETYIRDHSEAEFSHGICPDCARKLYPEFYYKTDESKEK